MDQSPRQENPGPGGSGEEKESVTDYWTLAAQTPPIPPDETPSIVGFREISGDELILAQRDCSLIQEIAPVRPYANVAQAFEALTKLIEDTAVRATNGQLRPRDQGALGATLQTYASAVGCLPEDLGSSLRLRLPEGSDSLARWEALRLRKPHSAASVWPARFRLCRSFAADGHRRGGRNRTRHGAGGAP
jgi:hypothetical protein